MIVLAILATILALGWTWFVLMANAMSSSPTARFQGGWTLILVWLGVVALWAAWWVG